MHPAVCAEPTGPPSARALDDQFRDAYPELRRLAHARLRDGGRDVCLDTTALVHESYLRAARSATLTADNRAAFLAYASRVMRSVIIDTVRERLAQRRGGDWDRVTLDTRAGAALQPDPAEHILSVHGALQTLHAAEPRLAQVVEMRYFGGYADADIAEALGIHERTVRRDWEKARWLMSLMLET